MAEREGFLDRWSRLKRAEAELPAAERAPAELAPPGCEPVDLDSLPPLESLCADSDYTAFLQRGVPESMQTVALRKAWVTDPAIAGFRGLADYDWDCNAPGYASLLPGDDVVRLCEAVLGPPPAVAADAPVQLAAVGTEDGLAGTETTEPAAADDEGKVA